MSETVSFGIRTVGLHPIPGNPVHPAMFAAWKRKEFVPPLLKSILLAEDSADDETLFLRNLREAGVENPVCVVRDGDEAIAYLKGEGGFADRKAYPLPCALFLDLKMRRVGGLEVLRWIRTQDDLQKLLAVVVTVSNEPKAIREAYQMGAHSFLTKPVAQRDVKNLLQHFRASLAPAIAMAALVNLVQTGSLVF